MLIWSAIYISLRDHKIVSYIANSTHIKCTQAGLRPHQPSAQQYKQTNSHNLCIINNIGSKVFSMLPLSRRVQISVFNACPIQCSILLVVSCVCLLPLCRFFRLNNSFRFDCGQLTLFGFRCISKRVQFLILPQLLYSDVLNDRKHTLYLSTSFSVYNTSIS